MIDLRKNVHPVQKLIEQNVITLDQVLEFAQQYMDAMNAFDDERLQQSSWECSEGTLHNYDDVCECEAHRDEFEKEMYEEYVKEMNARLDDEEDLIVRSNNPEYLLASTWWEQKETLVFSSNQNGDIVSLDDYGGIAERWGCRNWDSHHDVVNSLFGVPSYKLVWERKTPDGKKHHALYKRQYDVVETN